MEGHSCGGELMLLKLSFPNLHIKQYVVPSPISIIGKFFLSIHRYGRYQ